MLTFLKFGGLGLWKKNKMILSQRIVNNDNTKENDLFKEYIINVENYSKTHIFSNIERGIISTTFKEYLYDVFDVSNQQELIKKINGEWKLILEDGIDDFKLNETEKIVTIYYGNYKMFYYVLFPIVITTCLNKLF